MINVLRRKATYSKTDDKSVGLRMEEKHPLAIRWFHWVNFPVLTIMVWSGILIYWAAFKDTGNPHNHGIYTISFFGHELFRFFPDSFYAPGANEAKHIPGVYSLDGRLAEGMSWHFLFMWIFGINGLLYVIYTALSGEWRHILPDRKSVKDSLLVVLHDLHIVKQAPPSGKFNAAQKIAYTMVIVMGLGSLVTGVAIYKPIQASRFTQLLGGYEVARYFHFWLMILFSLFFLVHVAQVVRAGWNNFRAMVTGYELVEEELA